MTYIPRKKTQSRSVKLLLNAIDTFKTYNGAMSDELLGWKAIQDTAVVTRLRAGGDITTKKYEDFLDFLVSPPKGFLPLKTKEN